MMPELEIPELDIRPMGDRAVVVTLDGLDEVHRLAVAVRRAAIAVDVVPTWRRLLVTTDGDLERLVGGIRELAAGAEPAGEADHLVIGVVYDGEDLDDVAAMCSMTVADVIELHSGALYTVAFLGFSRAFPYLAGLDPRLSVPRLASPRSRVPAGSVGIVTGACGIYPTASPGGWRLIGRTTAVMFDEFRSPPSLLAAGDRVSFRAVDG